MTGGALARTPKIALTESEGSARRTTHRYVSVSRAPEPNDLWWENTLYGGWPIVQRRIWAWLGYFLLLGVAFCVQVYSIHGLLCYVAAHHSHLLRRRGGL